MVPAIAEKRVALVIGNGSYSHIAHLPNVANDAATMAALFRTAKFDAVDVRHNLGVAELRRALRDFAGQAADADVAVLFYAGHGIEVGQVNYLIPVDARLITDYDVEDETVALDRILQAMEPAKRLRLVILDACRENPFVKSMKRMVAARSVGRGLGRVEPSTTNTLIAFATKPNAIAEDGKGSNSPFTAALVKHLLTPNLDLRIALGHVRDEVMASTASKQEPYVTGSLGGGIVSIVGNDPKSGALTPQPQSTEAERAWGLAKGTASITALEAFIRRFGDTYYGDLAKMQLAELRQAASAKEAATSKAEEEAQAKAAAERQRLAMLRAEQDGKRIADDAAAKKAAEEAQTKRLAQEEAKRQRIAMLKAEQETKRAAEAAANRKADGEKAQPDRAEQQRLAALEAARAKGGRGNAASCEARARAVLKNLGQSGAIAVGATDCGYSVLGGRNSDNYALAACRRRTTRCKLVD
jgi:uncharacterized caspase-like protein